MARSGMAEPAQKPGRSKQDYGTPPEFLRVVEARFGQIGWDLAAHVGNGVWGPRYFGPGSAYGEDSLAADWNSVPDAHLWPVLWLNPPFKNIAPWAAKAAAYTGRGRIVMLTPASIGTDWFADHVHGVAEVFAIRPRLTFVGTAPSKKTGKPQPYPKDLMLSVFDPSREGGGLYCWRWK